MPSHGKRPSLRKNKEEAIFDAAVRIIKQKGFHKARTSDIANEAGISYGLVYHYYYNKEDLFEARYLIYIFLSALETFVSAMVLVDQKIKGDPQKKDRTEYPGGLLEWGVKP